MYNRFTIEHYFIDCPPEQSSNNQLLLGGTEGIEMIDQAYCDALNYKLGDDVRIHGPPNFQIRRIGAATLMAVRPEVELRSLAPLNAISREITREILMNGSNVSILNAEYLYARTRLRAKP